jgi:hypothetical protein
MYSPVLFPHGEKILYGVISGIDPACHLIGNAETFGPVKTVIGKQEPESQSLQHQESKKSEIAANEEENVTHGPSDLPEG